MEEINACGAILEVVMILMGFKGFKKTTARNLKQG